MENEKELENLVDLWKASKSAENQAKNKRLEAEERILELSNGDKSVFDLSLSYGETRTFNHDMLAEAKEQIKDEFFPFKVTYKEDRSASRALEKMHPDLWEKFFAPALTIKPKKVSFSLKEKK